MTPFRASLSPYKIFALALLLLSIATPYHMHSPYYGVGMASAPAWAALGSLCGIAIAKALEDTYKNAALRFAQESILNPRVQNAFAVLGTAFVLYATIPEWATLPALLSSDGDWDVFAGAVDEYFGIASIHIVPFQQVMLLLGSALLPLTWATRAKNTLTSGAQSEFVDSLTPSIISSLGGLLSLCIWPYLFPVGFSGEDGVYTTYAPSNLIACLTPFVLLCITLALAISWQRTTQKKNVTLPRLQNTLIHAVIALLLGVLVWEAMIRTVPIYRAISSEGFLLCFVAYISGLALLAGIIAHRLSTRHRHSSRENSEAINEVEKNIDDSFVQEMLQPFSLSPRENEAVLLAIQGMTSEQAGETMGVKSATVRSLLQRSYRKIGCADKNELLALFSPSQIPKESVRESTNQSSARVMSSRIQSLAQYILPISILATTCILFMPHHINGHGWGMGRELIYGVGTGAVLAGFAGISILNLHAHLKRINRLATGCAASLTYLLAGLVLVSSSFIAHIFGVYNPPLSLGMFGSSALFAFMNATFLFFVQSGKSPARHAWQIAAVTCAALVAIAYASPLGWLLSVLLTLILASVSAFVILIAPQQIGKKAAPLTPSGFSFRFSTRTIYLAIATATFGFVTEEAWRDLGSFSLVDASIPFLIATSICSLAALYRTGKHIGVPLVLGLCFSLLAIFRQTLSPLIQFALLVFGLALSSVNARKDLIGARDLSSASVAYGIAFFAGDVAINHLGDAFWDANDFIGTMFITADAFELTAVYIAGVAFLIASIAVGALFSRLTYAATKDTSLQAIDADSKQRIMDYLSGRGLNPTQVLVITAIAQGQASSDIARHHGYSRGSINSARRVGYQKLNVHSQADLVKLLSQETAL